MDLPVTTQISTPFNLDIVQVEVSSKCTLKCPRCPRTELSLPWLNEEISLEEFKHIFPPDILNRIKFLLFCGHTGDPIYAKQFLDIVEYVKKNSNTRLQIITNGSHKKKQWWKHLGRLLDSNDGVTFSIDGWDDESNNRYRVNSDWDSIMLGLQTLRGSSSCYICWSTIYFKYNQDQIPLIKHIAQSQGCDMLILVRSAKFDNRYLVNGIDPLKPSQSLVADTNNYSREKIVFGRDDNFKISGNRPTHPYAKCINHDKEINVDVNGLVFPCGWFNTGYQINPFVDKYKDRLNAKVHGLKTVLEDEIWKELVQEFNLDICRIKCKNAAI